MDATETREDSMPGAVDKRGTLLLVDDDEDVLAITTDVLDTLGYHVLSADNGKQAESLFHQGPERIDAVLLDVSLPNLSGPELAERLRVSHPELPVLFVTGHVHGEEEPLAQDDRTIVVRKPYSIEKIARVLDALLSC